MRARDLIGIFELLDEELIVGPQRDVPSSARFEDVFSDDWRQAVLSDTPSCGPVGWRGFMLAAGRVWYAKAPSGWRIIAVNGSTKVEPEE